VNNTIVPIVTAVARSLFIACPLKKYRPVPQTVLFGENARECGLEKPFKYYKSVTRVIRR